MSWFDLEMGFRWNIENVWDKLTHPFTRVFYWAVKSFQYSMFLWNDFDWDYSYILYLLQYKLKRTRERILKNNLVLSSEQIAAQIKHAEDLIQNWHNDNWCEDLQKAHDKKWGDRIDLSKSFKTSSGSTMYTWNISREKATTQKLKDQESREQMIIYNAEEDARQKNFDELFAHLNKYIRSWWD